MIPKITVPLIAATACLTSLACADEAEPVEAAQVADAKQWPQPPEMMLEEDIDYWALIKTNMGDIKIDLYEDSAPKTVNNFVFLANEDFYDGVTFHRVINDFMIQGGDPTGTGRGGPGYRFADELDHDKQSHEPFTLSMANAGPNTNGSQFFITDAATPFLDAKHTVFGKAVEGQDVVEKISEVATTGRARGDRPLEDVIMEDVIILLVTDEGRPATQPS
jgi:peptidyl-prolyl cis-trans isomerase B (cyclophilin B)